MLKFLRNIIIIGLVIAGGVILYKSYFGDNKTGEASPEICEIVKAPRKYAKLKQVTVKGKVAGSNSFLGVNMYELSQEKDTCSINVVSQGASPKTGQELTVKGEVQEAYKIGDNRMLVIIED